MWNLVRGVTLPRGVLWRLGFPGSGNTYAQPGCVVRRGALTMQRSMTMLAALMAIATAARAQAARDSVVYALSSASRFEVKTGKAGLMGFAGHEHVIRARAFTGRVVHVPGAPSSSRVEVTVPTDSLE